jgi:hypothetical protein
MKKREKITYIDDGRTIADMSNVTGSRLSKRHPATPGPTFREAWKTYWDAVKMMFGPMLIVICGLGIVYMVLYAIFLFL